ncbi:RNA polymerase II subunit A C-terminal domain phosphatase, partial [Aptenodytes patagonicus]
VLVRLEGCSHPVVMKGLCAECGQDLTQIRSKNGKQNVPLSTATVSMVHSVPELKVSSEQAEQLGREDQQRLHRNRKLVLMVDLDQTLIHTTEQHCQQMSNKGIFHFQLGRGEPMLHTRLRPHCKEFLEKIAKLYELHVFTFGSRLYAHTIAGFLDPEKKLFSHRILSRDECIDPFSKTGNLRYVYGSYALNKIGQQKQQQQYAKYNKNYSLSKQLGSLSREGGIDKEIGKGTRVLSLWRRFLSSMKERYPFKEDVICCPSKWITMEKGIQFLRELAVLEVIYDDLNNEQLSKDPDEVKDTRPMWRKFVRSSPSSYANSLAVMTWKDGEGQMVDELAGQLRQYEESLSSSLVSAVEKLSREIQQLREDRPYSSPVRTSTSAIRSQRSSAQEREYKGYTPRGTLWFYLCDHGEDMRKWDGKPTSALEARVHELQGKTITERGSSRKIAAPVSSGQFPRQSRRADLTPDLNEETSDSYVQEMRNEYCTEKVRQAQDCKDLHVVNPDWLWSCLERWDKVEEQLFPLKDDYIKTHRENSPATFPDTHSTFQTALFHPTPIHPKSQPGPEVRLYDPNTGKLIRKGAQTSGQSMYIQSPAPPITLPVHGEHSSFRVVQPHQQQMFEEEDLPASENEEQPGPSKRKRQPSMSETMPLYTLCKEDLESMDKEVDDILGEGSDESDSEKKKPEEEGEKPQISATETLGMKTDQRPGSSSSSSSSSSERSLTGSVPRGHKRKLDEDDAASESSKESSNEDEEGSSSEADEMAAALEAELNDFM